MPNTREKLIELVQEGNHRCSKVSCQSCEYFAELAKCKANIIADHLIANGVTVQEWISVKDRLPNKGQIVLVCGSRKGIYTAEFRMDGSYPYFHKLNSKTHWCEPTHWMPLPEPPKGE